MFRIPTNIKSAIILAVPLCTIVLVAPIVYKQEKQFYQELEKEYDECLLSKNDKFFCKDYVERKKYYRRQMHNNTTNNYYRGY